MTIYRDQRAHGEIIAAGGMPMRLPIDWHLNLHEDESVFHLVIDDRSGVGPSVRLYVDSWPCDYWPCLTYERAIERAQEA